MNTLLRLPLLLLVGLGLVFSSSLAQADHRHKDHVKYDRDSRYWNAGYRPNKRPVYAKVVKAEPIIRYQQRSVPSKHCWDQRVRYRSDRHLSATPSIVGGIIGAAVGHELGKDSNSRNRRFKVLAGTLLGASIGNDIGYNNSRGDEGYSERVERRCETEHHSVTEQVIDGYYVTYRYRGKTYHTQMDYDPGKRIEVDVRVRPVI